MIMLPNDPRAIRGVKRPTSNKIVNTFTAQVHEWGSPCDEFEADCPACRAWAMFNKSFTVPSSDEVMLIIKGETK